MLLAFDALQILHQNKLSISRCSFLLSCSFLSFYSTQFFCSILTYFSVPYFYSLCVFFTHVSSKVLPSLLHLKKNQTNLSHWVTTWKGKLWSVCCWETVRYLKFFYTEQVATFFSFRFLDKTQRDPKFHKLLVRFRLFRVLF